MKQVVNTPIADPADAGYVAETAYSDHLLDTIGLH